MAKSKEKPKKEKAVKSAKPVKAEKTPKVKAVKAPEAMLAPATPPVAKEEKPPKVKKPTKAELAKAARAQALSEEEAQLVKKWQKLQKQYAEEKAENYAISGFFEIKTPLSHKVHGWGLVLNRRENYIDVIFETGMKTLIINYKG